MNFDEREVQLIEAARIMLLTGWTYADYLDTPLDVIDAVLQIHAGQKELEAWAHNQTMSRARRK